MTLPDGSQIPLGVKDERDKDAADAAYRKLVAELTATLRNQLPQPPPLAAQSSFTVNEIAEQFLERKKSKVSHGCWRQYDFCLRVHFAPVFGSRLVISLTGEEIEDWADRPKWSNSTRNNHLGTIQTLCKFAKHPIIIHRPPKESRGAEAVLSDEQFVKVIEASSQGDYRSDFPQLLSLLRETGARPQEVALLTVDSVNWSNTCTRTKLHKTRRHGGERIIHFNVAAMSVLERQRSLHKKGYLILTRCGNPWSCKAIVDRMAGISKRVGFHATAYGLGRHSFATRALIAGVPDTVVAALLGHRGTAMLHKHYSHIDSNSRVLKAAVEAMGRPKAG